MGWLDRLMFWRDRTECATDDAAAVITESEVDGCFTLPDATLDDMRRADLSAPGGSAPDAG
jgi:hypothetical protein